MKNGEWIIVHPTDCMTMLPVYQCSICKELTSGFAPKRCFNCESINTISPDKIVSIPIFERNY